MWIFLWQDDHFTDPFLTGAWPTGRLDADGRYVYLKDYTLDGVPEIVNDSWASKGNDSYVAIDWDRQITRCDQDNCSVVWEDWIASYGNAPLSTGLFHYYSTDYVYENNDQLILERRYSGLTVFWPFTKDDSVPVISESHNAAVYGWDTSNKYLKDADVIKRFIWDGTRYAIEEEQILEEPEVIASDKILETEGPNGELLTIRYGLDSFEDEDRGNTFRNDQCTLNMDYQQVGDTFLCKINFTKMQWRDVVGSGKEELILTTIAGDQSYIWPELVEERGCFHQRMLVYEWRNDQPVLIANITGCVRRSDLFGVEFDDFDEDGELEILAAPPWPLYLEREQENGISQDYIQVNQLLEFYEYDGDKFIPEWALEEN